MDDFMKIYMASQIMKNQNGNRDYNTAVQGYMAQGMAYPQALARADADFAPTPAEQAQAARKKETMAGLHALLGWATLVAFVVGQIVSEETFLRYWFFLWVPVVFGWGLRLLGWLLR